MANVLHRICLLELGMFIEQVRSTDGTGTLSYLLIDETEKIAVLIDPNLEDVDVIESLAMRKGVRVTGIVDTHTHADHISGAGVLREKMGAITIMHSNTRNKWKIVDQGDAFGIGDTLRANAAITVDRYVDDGDVIPVGSSSVHVTFTPGHTDNHIALMVDGCLFTGDLLLIGQAGRSDLPGGNPEEQYDSLFQKVLPLHDSTKIYPGHDYQDMQFSYLGDERRTNPFLQPRTKAEFVDFVKDFFPPFAENVAAGGKMTLQCGVQRVVQSGENIMNMTPAELNAIMNDNDKPLLLDVREPFELQQNGAIDGVMNVSIRLLKQRLGDLPANKEKRIVCVCQSGSRSLEAAHYLKQQGYTNVFNLTSGTSGWVASGFPVVRPKHSLA